MSSVSRMNPLLAKILLIVLLTLVLLLPLWRMESLIAERSALRDSAVERVANGVGHAQIIGAVMLIQPVTRTWVDGGKEFSETKMLRVLADSVDVTGSVVAPSCATPVSIRFRRSRPHCMSRDRSRTSRS